MKIIRYDKPASIHVRSTMDGQGAFGGLIIQSALIFALFFIVRYLQSEEANATGVWMLFLIIGSNFTAYYFMLHGPITRNLNNVTITREGITTSRFWNKRFIPSGDILKAILYYTYIRGSRGSEASYIVELVADLKNKKPLTLFYMEKSYWSDAYDEIHNTIIDTLIECGYSSSDDYISTPQA